MTSATLTIESNNKMMTSLSRCRFMYTVYVWVYRLLNACQRHHSINTWIAGADPKICWWGRPSLLSCPSLFLPCPPLPFPCPPFPSPPFSFWSRTLLNQLEGLGESCKLPKTPPSGSGPEPLPKTNLVHSRAVKKPLVAIILSILKCMFYSRTIKISHLP